MINFNERSAVFNLRPVEKISCQEDLQKLMITGESIIQAFKTVRDMIIFTNKRIITVDIQGVGVKKDFVTLPYSKIQYFSVQTKGLVELVHDCELQLFFSDGFAARFEFTGRTDIVAIGHAISEYAL